MATKNDTGVRVKMVGPIATNSSVGPLWVNGYAVFVDGYQRSTAMRRYAARELAHRIAAERAFEKQSSTEAAERTK